MLLCNLTSDKKEDGLARLIVRSDLQRLCHKPQAMVVQQCEDALRDSHKIKDSLPREGLSGDEIIKPLGQFFVRIALLATSKERSWGGRKRSTHCKRFGQCILRTSVPSVILQDRRGAG